MSERRHIGPIEMLALRGGRLCLDYVNTLGWRTSNTPHEWLTTYDALVAWSLHTGSVTEREAKRLRREAGEQPAIAEAVLIQALILREALSRIFSAITQGDVPGSSELARLSSAYSAAQTQVGILATPEGFTLDWQKKEALDYPLWPIGRSAVEVLISPEVKWVHVCEGEGCGWLFLDMSRNHSRRWCDSQDCGNRVRVRRHYQRGRET
jgi:predicted RNA-binding Zn ribbon-like protein